MRNNSNVTSIATGLWANRHLRNLAFIMVACSIFYHLPFFAGLVGWTSLQQALSTLHDFYGLIFFAPVVYAAYVFGVTGAMLTAFITILILLPYATSTDPYLESLFRATAFGIILCAVGSAVALIQKGDAQHHRSINELRHLFDVKKAADTSDSLDEFLSSIIELIPQAVQCPDQTKVKIEVGDKMHQSPDFGQQGLESVVTIPLRSNGIPPGLLTLACPPQYRFSAQELELLESIGEQIAVGIANAELHEETKQNVERLALMGETAKIIASSLDINEVCQAFTAAIMKLVDFDEASIHLVEETGQTMRVSVLSNDVPTNMADGATFAVQGTGTEWVVNNRKPHIEKDIQREKCFTSDKFIIANGFKSTIRLPLIAKGRAFGTFNLRSVRSNAYGQKDAELLERIVGQLAVAIENAALLSCVQSHEEQLEKTHEALEAAQDYMAQSEKRTKLLAAMAAGMMNEFNSVLSVMMSRIQLAIKDTGDSRVRESLQIIEHSALDAANTVRRLQDSAKENLHEDVEIMNINDMMKSAIHMETTQRGRRGDGDGDGIDIALKSQKTPLNHESEAEIKKAVMNILVNAMNATPSTGNADQHKKENTIEDEDIALPIHPVAMADLQGNLIYVNASFLEQWGYDSERDVLGKPTGQFWQEEEQTIPISEILYEQESWQTELMAIRKDGSTFDVQVSATMVSEVGKPICMRASFIDITNRKQAEKELKKSFKNLRKALEATVAVLTSTIEKRYPNVASHQLRVARLASAIAREMGLPDKQVEEIRVAGTLHDIGKINIPTEILDEPTWLTDIEIAVIKTHPQVGYDMVRMLPFDGPIAEIILQHHELLDGSGYPSGLSGEGILPGARILAVADVIETVACHRSYRSAAGIEEALNEISQNKGVLYDIAVVDACLRLFTEKGFKFEPALSGATDRWGN
ncbi:MAG: HD domain-containing phosphohydrolase [Dehalococcoidia bacterium]